MKRFHHKIPLCEEKTGGLSQKNEYKKLKRTEGRGVKGKQAKPEVRIQKEQE